MRKMHNGFRMRLPVVENYNEFCRETKVVATLLDKVEGMNENDAVSITAGELKSLIVSLSFINKELNKLENFVGSRLGYES